MSEFSERVQAEFNQMVRQAIGDEADNLEPDQTYYRDLNAALGDEFDPEYTIPDVIAALMKPYRYYAGRVWASTEDAYTTTQEMCREALRDFCTKALVGGMHIGQNELPVVKKYMFFQKPSELLGDDSFKTEVDSAALTLSLDYDFMEFMSTYARLSSEAMFQAAHYTDQPGDMDKIQRGLWALWFIAFNSVSQTCYLVGRRHGEKNKVSNTLAGILSATDSQGETGDGQQ